MNGFDESGGPDGPGGEPGGPGSGPVRGALVQGKYTSLNVVAYSLKFSVPPFHSHIYGFLIFNSEVGNIKSRSKCDFKTMVQM